MTAKRELCREHGKQLEATKLFGGTPFREEIESGHGIQCGFETIRLYGKSMVKRVLMCNQNAELRYSFGRIYVIEHHKKKLH